ncbi:hypothetical protein ACTU6U_02990 [Microbacterium sp. A196]|uniref:hypothetical protein n=1 Tax=Microbacterium sp. A196 TaxID=3457320 RepID=UPI003FD4FAE9
MKLPYRGLFRGAALLASASSILDLIVAVRTPVARGVARDRRRGALTGPRAHPDF